MASLINDLGLDRLRPDERLRLVEELCESLDSEGNWPPLTDAQRLELDRRMAELDANPGSVIPWNMVEAEALARLHK